MLLSTSAINMQLIPSVDYFLSSWIAPPAPGWSDCGRVNQKLFGIGIILINKPSFDLTLATSFVMLEI